MDKMDSKYPRLDDGEIQNWIDDTRNAYRDWAREYAVSGPLSVASDEEAEKLLRSPLDDEPCPAGPRFRKRIPIWSIFGAP